MGDFELRRITLSTGIALDVAAAGDREAPAMIFLHGFPESHRTWRHQLDAFAKDHFVIAPDQRGFARSDKPASVEDYAAEHMVADLAALADHFEIERFTLVGHDWGGAVAWMAALRLAPRIERLVIINAPHPLVFQRSLFDDLEQRGASQYITAFRNPDFEQFVERMGLSTFFDTSFRPHADLDAMAKEKPVYLDQWSQPGALTAMLNWYRASAVIVPGMDETPRRPAFLDAPFPAVTMPTLVVWAVRDVALLPCQLEGIGALVAQLTVTEIDAGHFAPWQAPEAVNGAIRGWLDEGAGS
jgi:pimeloyl-ACP methyl ester carboxylesterase